MSMYLEFEPHSWYMHFAIKQNGNDPCQYILDGRDADGTEWYVCITHAEEALSDSVPCAGWERHSWTALTDDGNTYRIIELQADTLQALRKQIRDYHRRDNGSQMPARPVNYLERDK